MILHLDDRLLHGKILHGWSAASAGRILLISDSLDDEALARAYTRAADPVDLLCLSASGDSFPPEREGDFWLTDSLASAEIWVGRNPRISALVVIGLRQGGDELGPDFSPDSASRELMDELALRGLKIEIRAFPGSQAWTWPPRSSNTP